tara:strand:+ start:1082 stop:2065 length:984 start_codon:yes stop_codon:yes gene_type:complete
MVGKLTDDSKPTASTMAQILGESPYGSRNEQLDKCIRAKNGENVRTEQTNIMRSGDVLETPLLHEAVKRLNLDYCQLDILEKVVHPRIDLEGSLDGLAYSKDGITIQEDTSKGIYVMTDSKSITIEGEAILECKCTNNFGETDPPGWRGVIQLQTLMEIKNAQYGILVVLYQSTDLRIFIYPVDPHWTSAITRAAVEFSQRVKSENYYPIESLVDGSITNPSVKKESLDLDTDAIDAIDLFQSAQKSIKLWQSVKDDAQIELMRIMGDYEIGKINVSNDDGSKDFVVKWGMINRKAQPEKIVPAKEASSKRSKTLSIKEYENEIQDK